MNELHQKILDAVRDEVLKNHGLREWNYDLFALEDIRFEIGEPPYTSDLLNNESALLAMERQAEFYEWASREWWHEGTLKRWFHCDDRKRLKNKTTEELYEIWEASSS